VPHNLSLKSKKHFDDLFKKGYRKHSRNFTIVFYPDKVNSFAFITPKKYIKLASHRNYTRRISREIVRNYFKNKEKQTKQYAILSKTDLKEINRTSQFKEIEIELTSLLNSIR
jgi:ribonuclease P protein component